MDRIQNILINKIETNPKQPRKFFDEQSLVELSQSIQQNGLIQPIVVRPILNGYSLIAGERRLRAYKLLKQTQIPAFIIEVSQNQAENFSLIENIQRLDLTPIEEAQAFAEILSSQKITQEQLAQKVGKSQSAIANKLRLLQLSPVVLSALSSKKISERHGRSLIGLSNDRQEEVLKQIIRGDLNVAQTEKLISLNKAVKKTKHKNSSVGKASQVMLGINTIKEAITMIESTGIPFEKEIYEDAFECQILVKFKK